MNRQEYIDKCNSSDDWSPGWEAIDDEIGLHYKNEPYHLASDIQTRAILGGDAYLDGVSIYSNDEGFQHIVTYGMTDLYADTEAFGKEWNGWGYEMTMKLKADTPEESSWVVNLFMNIAKYTFTQERHFEEYSFLPGNGSSIRTNYESSITALLCVKDTIFNTIDTIHGRVEFIQFVGITHNEEQAIKRDRSNMGLLIERMKADNPHLVLDMDRNFSYIE